MRRPPARILIATWWLAFAPSALALPVEVAFSGSISNVAGVAPGGIVETTAFSGSLSYDPAADQNANSWRFELAGSAFSLQLDIGGASFENDSQSGPLHAWYDILFVDEHLVPVDAQDQDAIPLIYLFGSGYLREVATNDVYSFSLDFSMLLDGDIPSFLTPQSRLPTSLELAEFMTGGPQTLVDFLHIGNTSQPPTLYGGEPLVCGLGPSGFCIEALVANAAAVPEPSTASLLLLGLAALGAAARRAPCRIGAGDLVHHAHCDTRARN
ncbi:MAG: PEP-CTERM sorting domain-containing protein [Deltaproteobacteria bacterium]|nr:PEP-CTERM sorting domain-containing protein [Deltaproteobacteria bacterium]MBW2401240.1 PEP-CTERM sorting domain-containing protein [Deltaproteobacteria bacterium]MBW2667314.1 PEP-CTERM sorting domain-containing protein [Deltaproteobacteria bacterium]